MRKTYDAVNGSNLSCMSRTLPSIWFLALEWLKGHQRAIYGAKNACFELSVLLIEHPQ